MPEPLDHVAQPVGPYGDISGKGLGNLLGAPNLDGVELLVRESVQNSWDARLSDSDGIDYGIRSCKLSPKQSAAFQVYCVNSSEQALRHSGGALPRQPRVLFVYDRGTRGLGGPIDPQGDVGGPRDFINFVYMIGETKREEDNTGGTYGYGRSSFFVASSCRTIFVHTRVKHEGRLEERFVGIAWRQASTHNGKRTTGRHWWGRRHSDGTVRPVIGPDASAIARELGFPGFEGDATGTTVMVVDPEFAPPTEGDGSGFEEYSMLQRIESALLWNCWPRILEGDIRPQVEWDDATGSVDPQREPVLKSFIHSWKEARLHAMKADLEPPTFTLRRVPETLKPARRLGTLVSSRRPVDAADPRGPYGPIAASGCREILCHTALVRSPGLIVKYEKGPPPPEGQEYAGVFVANIEHDKVFADSEPPSHDDWVSKRLARRSDKIVVNGTFRLIERELRDWLTPVQPSGPTKGPQEPLAHVSDLLGALVPDLAGTGRGGGSGGGGGGGGGGGSRNGVKLAWRPKRREASENGIRVVFSVRNTGTAPGRIRPVVKVLTDNGAEKDSPVGAGMPRGEGWLDDPGSPETTRLEPGAAKEFAVFQPADCALDVSFAGTKED